MLKCRTSHELHALMAHMRTCIMSHEASANAGHLAQLLTSARKLLHINNAPAAGESRVLHVLVVWSSHVTVYFWTRALADALAAKMTQLRVPSAVTRKLLATLSRNPKYGYLWRSPLLPGRVRLLREFSEAYPNYLDWLKVLQSHAGMLREQMSRVLRSGLILLRAEEAGRWRALVQAYPPILNAKAEHVLARERLLARALQR